MESYPSASERDFSIHHSFWYYLNPARWTRRSLLASFIAFYTILSGAYFIIAFQPAQATPVLQNYQTSSDSIVQSKVSIPELGISSDIVDVEISGSTLPTPDYLVGRYDVHENKTFLFAHSTTAFRGLDAVREDMVITYDDADYVVTDIIDIPVADVNMRALLASADEPTLVLMTCSGVETISGFPRRLIITAHLLD